MKKIILLFSVAFALHAQSQTNTFPTTGSAGLGTLAPNASAALEMVSNSKGLLIPRMTKAQRDAIVAPASGLMIYQTNSNPGFYYYTGSAWGELRPAKANTNLGNLSATTSINSSLLPATTGIVDLGSATKYWKDLFLSGNAIVGGNGEFTGTVSVAGNVGIGTNPATRLDINGSGAWDLSSTNGDFRMGDATNNLKMGVALGGGGTGDGYLAASGRLYLGTSNSLAATQTLAINSDGTVGVGTISPAGRMGIVGDAALTSPVLSINNSYVGSSDVRGIQSNSKAADGYGYGIFSTGGYMGGYLFADAGAYSGNGYGVYGVASGTAGNRIGVYGSASGSGENWGGYFPTKTYTGELRVGGTKGTAGFVACINGKLIATEVRVQPTASWPDYVFSKDYKLMSLEELESKINADKHLPNIPAATDVKENGIMLGEMQTKAMEKIEELTLYMIELSKQNKELKKEIENLKILVNAKK